MKALRSDLTFIICALAAVAAIAIFSGCDPVKRQARRCATCVLESKKSDSTSIATKDRPIIVYVHDTIETQTPNPCAELCDSLGRLKATFTRTLTGNKPGTKIRVYVDNDSLRFVAILDSLKANGMAKDSLIHRLITIENTAPARCELDHVSDLDAFFIVSGKAAWIILGLVAVGWYLQRRARRHL